MIKIEKLKRKTTKLLLCSMCLLGVICVSCLDDDLDEEHQITISGVVVDGDGWPLGNASVVLKNSAKKELFSTITERNGRFNFDFVNASSASTKTFYISVQKSGYSSYSNKIVLKNTNETELRILMKSNE